MNKIKLFNIAFLAGIIIISGCSKDESKNSVENGIKPISELETSVIGSSASCSIDQAERENQFQKELADPPSMSIGILERSDKEILKWLDEIDTWPFQAIPLKFSACEINSVQQHLERVLPTQRATDFIKEAYGFDEKQNEYYMKNGDNHPDLSAWYDVNIEILKDEYLDIVTLLLSGKNDYEIEGTIGFDFEVVKNELKILKFKYYIQN